MKFRKKNQRLLFRSLSRRSRNQPTVRSSPSLSSLLDEHRQGPKGGCSAGTERGKDVGPGGRAAPRAAAEVVGPLALHTPLSNSCEAHAWDSSSPSFLDRLPGCGAPRFSGSRGSWGCKTGFLHFTFSPVCNAPPLRPMLLLFPNAYATVFELRRSHDLKWARRGCLIFYGSRYEIHDPFLSLSSH